MFYMVVNVKLYGKVGNFTWISVSTDAEFHKILLIVKSLNFNQRRTAGEDMEWMPAQRGGWHG